MALCMIGRRLEFSQNYNNYWFKGYDVDDLVCRVESMLAARRPDLVWLPYTGEMGIEHTSLYQARAENDIEEIRDLMAELWAKAQSQVDAENSKHSKS